MKKRFTEEQIIGFLREAEAGMPVKELCRKHGFPEAYADVVQGVFTRWGQSSPAITHSRDVANAVWRAANDPSCPVRIPAGADAVALAESLRNARN